MSDELKLKLYKLTMDDGSVAELAHHSPEEAARLATKAWGSVAKDTRRISVEQPHYDWKKDEPMWAVGFFYRDGKKGVINVAETNATVDLTHKLGDATAEKLAARLLKQEYLHRFHNLGDKSDECIALYVGYLALQARHQATSA